jgi:hypothetical protein
MRTMKDRMGSVAKIWKYALGSFSDDRTKEYDNHVLVVRSIIFFTYLITNCFIISGVIRHWNANEKTTDCDRTSRIWESPVRQIVLSTS